MSVRINGKDYLWSYIGIFFSVGSSVIIMPFVLYFLSDEMYGLWSVFQSMSVITTLFDFGFSTTFARNINYCWNGAEELKTTGVRFATDGAPNYPLMKVTMKACQYVFLLLSGIALACLASFGTLYVAHITQDISGPEPMIAWVFYGIAIFLNLYYGYFNAFLYGVGAVAAVNRATVISRIVQICLTILLLLSGLGIVGTAIAYLAYGFVFRVLGKWSFFRYKGIGQSLQATGTNPTRREVWESFRVVWHNASREGIVTLANYLANQACTIICPLFLTLAQTGVYSLAVQLATVLANVAGGVYSANQPVLQSAYISNDKPRTKRTMSLIVVSYVLLYVVGLIAVVTVGLPILRLIKPSTTPSIAVMLGAGIYQFILKFRNCYTSYFSCTNRIPYAGSFICSSVLCVCLALLFLGGARLGIWGLLLAQIVSQIVFNVWYWPRLAHREMQLSAPEMVRLGVDEIGKLLRNFTKGTTSE